MKISPSGVGNLFGAYAKQKNAMDKCEVAKQAQLTAADQVELSAQARDLRRAQEIVAASTAVRHCKVAELTTALEQGRYCIDPTAIAAAILHQAGEFRRGAQP
ncbi:MAG TPA: flagellar biosynthesis anti-sigma factor FlgM [bacterium]|jgi:flagellar biosynthesis anti-sigma factor FlgM|nr:flagellar biosynthesis anti-sigma factor FlgM [bacterium]